MKVLFILSTTQLDGSTFSCITLMEGLIGRGCSVVAIIPDNNEAFISRLAEFGIISHVIPVEFNQWPNGKRGSFHYFNTLIYTLKNRFNIFRQLCRIVKQEHPDIIHTNVSPIDVGYYSAITFRIPHVWHIREYCDKDFDIHLFPNNFWYRKKIKHSYSIAITKDLQSYNKLAGSKRSFVIYNGVRHKDSIYYSKEKERFFLVASRVSKEKDQARIIRVFAKFLKNQPNYKLIILGRCNVEYRDECISLAKNLGIVDDVIFEGFKTNVDSYLKKATALLVASPYEGFGRMTAEAAFNGCLVIGYDSAGTKEILESTGGYLWRTDDDFLKAMNEVASMSIDEYGRKIEMAQTVAQRSFSIESYIDGIVSIYNEILCNK